MALVSPGATLRDEQQLIASIVELMQSERRFLISADADGLSDLVPKKLQLSQQAAGLARMRHQALGRAGFAAAEAGMAPWLATQADADARAEWERLLELGRQAKEMNRVNGMLINKQLAHTQGNLNALRGSGNGANAVYGPAGHTVGAGASRRYLVG